MKSKNATNTLWQAAHNTLRTAGRSQSVQQDGNQPT